MQVKTPSGLLHSIRLTKDGVTAVRRGWLVEPVQRAGRRFEKLWQWMEENNLADWDKVHSLAYTFHPDHRFDVETRQLRPDGPRAAVLYELMERGEYDRAAIESVHAELVKAHPKRVRGVPMGWHQLTLLVAAHLACHVFERLDFALSEQPPDESAVAKHLYWFERFFALFLATAEKPPAKVNKEVKAQVDARTADLLRFHLARVQKNSRRTVTPSESAKGFQSDPTALSSSSYTMPRGDEGIRTLGKELRAALKKEAGANMRGDTPVPPLDASRT